MEILRAVLVEISEGILMNLWTFLELEVLFGEIRGADCCGDLMEILRRFDVKVVRKFI
jgi:hypothetical protein